MNKKTASIFLSMLLICSAGLAGAQPLTSDADAQATDGLVFSVADAEATGVTAQSGNWHIKNSAQAIATANQANKPGGYSFSWADSYTRKGISTGATGTPTYIGGADASAEAYGDILAATGSVAYTEARRFTNPPFAIGIAHSGATSASDGADAQAVGLGLAYNAQPNPNPGSPSIQEAGAFTYNFAYTTDPYAEARSYSGAYDDVNLDPVVPDNAAYAMADSWADGDNVIATATTVATMVLGGDVEVECHDENLNPVMVTFEEGLNAFANGVASSESNNGLSLADATGTANAAADSGTVQALTYNWAMTQPWYSAANSWSSASNDDDWASSSAYGSAWGETTYAGVVTNAMVGSAEADAHSNTYAIGSWDWSGVSSSTYASNTDDYAGSYAGGSAYGESEYAEATTNAMVGSAEADAHSLSTASGWGYSGVDSYSNAYNTDSSSGSSTYAGAWGELTGASSETSAEVGSGSTMGTGSAGVFLGQAWTESSSWVWDADNYASSGASGYADGIFADTTATTTAQLGSAKTTGVVVSNAMWGMVSAGSNSIAVDIDDYASSSASGFATGDLAQTIVVTEAEVGSAAASGTSTSMASGEDYSEAGSTSAADVNGESSMAAASAVASGDETFAYTATYADGDTSSATAVSESSSESSGGN